MAPIVVLNTNVTLQDSNKAPATGDLVKVSLEIYEKVMNGLIFGVAHHPIPESIDLNDFYADKPSLAVKLYIGFLYAEKNNTIDQYVEKLIESDPQIYSLLIVSMAYIRSSRYATDIVKTHQPTEELVSPYDTIEAIGFRALEHDASPNEKLRTINNIVAEINKEFCASSYREGEPVQIECNPFFSGSNLWTNKYVLYLFVEDNYDPNNYKEVVDYCKGNGMIDLIFVTESERQTLPQNWGMDQEKLPKWELRIYDNTFWEIDTKTNALQQDLLFNFLQHDCEIIFNRTMDALPESRIHIYMNRYYRGRDSQAIVENVYTDLAFALGHSRQERMYRNISKLLGWTNVYIITPDESYATDSRYNDYGETSNQRQYLKAMQNVEGPMLGAMTRWAAEGSVGLFSSSYNVYVQYNLYDVETSNFLFAHELMHSVSHKLLGVHADSVPWLKKYFDHKREAHPVSPDEWDDPNWTRRYAATNTEEFFAETFASYVVGGRRREKLRQTDPFIYAVAERFFNADKLSTELIRNVEDMPMERDFTLPGVFNVGNKLSVGFELKDNNSRINASYNFTHEIAPKLGLQFAAGLNYKPGENAFTGEIRNQFSYYLTDRTALSSMLLVEGGESMKPEASLFFGLKSNITALYDFVNLEIDFGVTTDSNGEISPFIGIKEMFLYF